MKIQLLSDLHLETQPNSVLTPASGADLLVLAGDIGSYQAGSQLPDADFGLARFSPLHGWPTPVFFVPGNHEYDAFDFDEAHERLQDTCRRLGITWLERTCVEMHGVRFIGTTLWTDFDALATHKNTGAHDSGDGSALSRMLKQRDKAFRAANFYLQKTGTTRHGTPWLAEQVREQALACQAWLRHALAEPFEGNTVVITHFAPSLHSADPRYGMTPGTAGFCNALDDLLPQANWWLHGHLHAPSHYQHRGCTVVANPMGYANKQEQAHFMPTLTLDVG